MDERSASLPINLASLQVETVLITVIKYNTMKTFVSHTVVDC